MPGVINILSGDKNHLAKHLCEHQQVNAIWYITDDDEKSLDTNLAAIRFINYTSNYNLKHNWSIANVFTKATVEENNFEEFLQNEYAQELARNSQQYKYVYIPMGTIFAN